MVSLYISSLAGSAGKSLLTLGIGLGLRQRGFKVGYLKPFGKTPQKSGRGIFDADALFIRESLSIEAPPEAVSPFVSAFGMPESKETPAKTKERLKAALKHFKEADVLIVGGAGGFFEGASLGLDTMSLAGALKAGVLFVEPWAEEPSMDALVGVKRLLGESLLGAVLNKVPERMHKHAREKAVPFLRKRGIGVFGVFPTDALLSSITVRRLAEALSGKVLSSAERLDEFVENFSVGAMDVENAMKYFRRTPNKAVITGAHRSDIQLAALETSTKCIILTGGLHTNDVILGKAAVKGVPVISVPTDTFTTVEKIEALSGKMRIREKEKISRAEKMIKERFDLEGLLRALGLKRPKC